MSIRKRAGDTRRRKPILPEEIILYYRDPLTHKRKWIYENPTTGICRDPVTGERVELSNPQ